MDPFVADHLAHPFLRDLDTEHLRYLAGCADERRFAAGELLFARGGDAATFYLLVSGDVTLERLDDGRRVTVETLHPGDVVGSSWLVEPHRWLVDARARGPVVALAIDGVCVRHRMGTDAALGHAIARRFLDDLHRRLTRLWDEHAT